MPRVKLTFGFEPKAMPRAARDGRGSRHTYMPDDYMAYRDALSYAMIAARRQAGAELIQGLPVGLVVTFQLGTRRRVDMDNLLKTVMDAGNGVLWTDDWQVAEVTMGKTYNPGAACTELEAFVL